MESTVESLNKIMNKTGKGFFQERFSHEKKLEIIDFYKLHQNITTTMGAFSCARGTVVKILTQAGVYKPNKSYNSNVYSANYRFFDIIDTEEKAYWIGFIAADGYVSSSKKGHHLNISLKWDDRDHITKFLTALSANHTIKQTKSKMKSGKVHYKSTITIHSKALVSDLQKHGVIQCKSKCLKFPSIPKNMIRHYIRGYFDGDGSWYLQKQKYPAFSVIGSTEFITDFRTILAQSCELSHNMLITTKHENIIRVRYTGAHQCCKIYHYMYEDCSVWMERKKDVVSSCFEPDTNCPLSKIMINRLSKFKSSIIAKCATRLS